MTREELKNYKKITLELKTIEDKLDYLKNKKIGIKSLVITDMPTNHSDSDRLLELLVDIESMINLYTEKQKKALSELRYIEEEIDKLDTLERTVIRYVYTNNKRFEEVACIINYSFRTVRRLHKSAIEKLEKQI